MKLRQKLTLSGFKIAIVTMSLAAYKQGKEDYLKDTYHEKDFKKNVKAKLNLEFGKRM